LELVAPVVAVMLDLMLVQDLLASQGLILLVAVVVVVQVITYLVQMVVPVSL
jgi:hypothetical protein